MQVDGYMYLRAAWMLDGGELFPNVLRVRLRFECFNVGIVDGVRGDVGSARVASRVTGMRAEDAVRFGIVFVLDGRENGLGGSFELFGRSIGVRLAVRGHGCDCVVEVVGSKVVELVEEKLLVDNIYI